MACNIKKTNLILTAEWTGVYQLEEWKFQEIVWIHSKCGPLFDYQIVSDRAIKFSCDIPCDCSPICVSYVEKESACVLDTKCC